VSTKELESSFESPYSNSMKNKEVIVTKLKNFINTNLEWVYEEEEGYGKLMLKKSDKHFVVVANFLKTKWGFGMKRDSSLGISFNYTNKIINGLENNKDFEVGINLVRGMI
jgi:hypothetical protein